ncbi:MAG: F0F1 ATP synthase subunit alpha [Patescibacteria group bacterium]|nr:F0F1 ATP synthase subunit alpha [Patescibacteria group bacterium]
MSKDFIIEQLKKQISGTDVSAETKKIGTVVEAGDGIARIIGLDDVMMSEMIRFDIDKKEDEEELYGVVLNLEEGAVGVIVIGEIHKIKEGTTVISTGKILSVPVAESMVGRVINPVGQPIDGGSSIDAESYYPIEKIAPGVIMRESVNQSLQTGIKAVDAMIPIGRGQRELIIGDRQTGKTAIAIDAIINQKGQEVVCIYVAIGQKKSKIAQIAAKLKEHEALEHTIIIVAGSSDSAAYSYIAPYAGCAIGEYFMDKGKDVLIIYDDLSKHAWSYRQISLLLKRPPGREAYPGDVFYLHSRLLERSAKISRDFGGGSLTALPIIETQAGDISAYIPTNVISITDGQIFLESDLFFQGIRPAINVGLSVSRVGSSAQTKAMKKVAGKVKLELAQFRELEAFTKFGSDLDEKTKKRINRGYKTVEVLKQNLYRPVSMEHQVVIMWALTNGYLDDVDTEKVKDFEKSFLRYVSETARKTLKEIKEIKEISEEIEKKLNKTAKDFKDIWNTENSTTSKGEKKPASNK